MPGRDPARGARDTGRTDRGIGERGNEGARGGRGGRRGGNLGVPSGKMQHSISPTDSTLPHMGGARNTTPGRDTTYDPDGKAAAIREARRQRPTNDLVAKTLQALGSLTPGLPSAIGIGNTMSQMTEEDAPANIDNLSTIPGDPGGFSYKKDGETYSNRAGFPGSDLANRDAAPNNKGGQLEIAAQAEERRKRRLAAQQTALGSVKDTLGPGVLPI